MSRPALTEEGLSFLINAADLSISELIDQFADLEGLAHVDEDSKELQCSYFAAYFLALFTDNELNEARFLWNRLPEHLSRDNYLLEISHSLLKALYTQSYSDVHAILSNASWTETIAPLAARFKEKFKADTFDLVSRAYSTITPAAASALLGLGDNEQDAVELLVKQGWEFDQNAGLLLPRSTEKEASSTSDVHGANSQSRIETLVGLATHITGV